jgi:FkbM family methyltransferase
MLSSRTDDSLLDTSQGARFFDVALIAYGRTFEHPSKIRFVRWLIRRLAGGRVQVRYAPGALISMDPSDYIGWAVFTKGHYEPASLRLALRIMRNDPGLFVDIGANFGWYTCAAGAIAGTRVISIEPDCENCALLRENIALNRLQNVVVFNGATGQNFDTVPISKRTRGNSGTIAIRSSDAEPLTGETWVATVPLEALLKRIVRPIARPVLLKIDVEGFEPQVLAGLDFDDSFRPKNILFEFDHRLAVSGWGTFDNLQSFFAARSYELLNIFGEPLNGSGSIPENNVWARDHRSF